MKFRWPLLTVVGLLLAGRLYASPADFTVTTPGFFYEINGSVDPELTLTRGQTYTFDVTSPGHPFYIKTVQETGTGSAYNTGVTNNGLTSGILTFVVPLDAPDPLFYICSLHGNMTNTIHIVNSVAVERSTWAGVKQLYN